MKTSILIDKLDIFGIIKKITGVSEDDMIMNVNQPPVYVNCNPSIAASTVSLTINCESATVAQNVESSLANFLTGKAADYQAKESKQANANNDTIQYAIVIQNYDNEMPSGIEVIGATDYQSAISRVKSSVKDCLKTIKDMGMKVIYSTGVHCDDNYEEFRVSWSDPETNVSFSTNWNVVKIDTITTTIASTK